MANLCPAGVMQQNEISDNAKNSATSFNVFSLAILIVLIDVPIIQRTFGGPLIILPFVALYFISCFTPKIRIQSDDKMFILCFFIYYAFVFGYKITGISSASPGHDIHSILYFTLFFAIKTVLRMSKQQKNFLLSVILFSMTYTIITNIILYNRLGSYRYFLLHHVAYGKELGNLATTQFSTGIVFLSGITFICFLKDRVRYRKILWLVVFAVCMYNNIEIAQRASNIIITVGMLLFIFVFNKKKKLYTDLFLIGLFVLFALFIEFHETILEIIAEITNSKRLSIRLANLSDLMTARELESAEGSLGARFSLVGTSISTWLGSLRAFFFGAGDHIDNNLTIGNHSQAFDVLAQYGIICGICFYYLIYKTLSSLMKKMSIVPKTNLYKQTVVLLIAFVIRGVIGAVVFEQIAISLFIFMPIVYSIISEGDQAYDSINL